MTNLTSYIVYRKEWALKWFIVIGITMACLFISNEFLNSKALSIIFLMLLVMPFLFMNKMIKYFTRKVIIQLNTDDISFNISKLNNDEEEEIKTYNLFDIASYQIQFPTYRFANLIMKFKSGKKQEFSFPRQSISDSQDDTNAVIETIHKYFEQNNIAFLPSFFASQKGLYAILFFLVLLCVPFALAIQLNKNLPATIIGSVAIIFQIISKRINDLSFYRKWKKA